VNLEIALSGVSAKVKPLDRFHAGRECVETSGDVIKICYVIRAFCQGILVDAEHSPREITRGKIKNRRRPGKPHERPRKSFATHG
jgi:hypothetical protein